MIKEMSYREKFKILNPLMPKIVETVKKDLKKEHLQKDWAFFKKNFAGKNINKITPEEMTAVYLKALEETEGAEELGEFIANRWLLKNTEAYDFFEQRLSQIDPNFQDLKEIEKTKALILMEEAIQNLGALRTYIFSILNSVVFPQEVFQELKKRSIHSQEQEKIQAHEQEEKATLENLQKNHEREIARLTDKYEKKLIGLQKKYVQDTECLKKQIASLRRGKSDPKAQ